MAAPISFSLSLSIFFFFLSVIFCCGENQDKFGEKMDLPPNLFPILVQTPLRILARQKESKDERRIERERERARERERELVCVCVCESKKFAFELSSTHLVSDFKL